MKYTAIFQKEYLINSNLLRAKTLDELEQLEKVVFYITEGLMEQEGYEFLFP
ncbi:hypothetical protein [Staphylococcus felis]|uniref:hypothetical protein n=1 Tax=Staphylococcus felis TaxID=46127 RepID=UPI0015F291E5|nr:hypothetical protein [Staphylococcus felis]